MKLIVLAYIGLLLLVFIVMTARYVGARVTETNVEVRRLNARSRLRHVSTPRADFSRINAIVDAERLRERRVALCGAGSLGSWLAYFLSHLIGELRVIDSDTVDVSNITGGRTIYSQNQLSMAKPLALKQILENGFPHLRVLAYNGDINELSDSFLEEILDCDLIICAVDDIQCILRINQLFYGRRTLVYGGFMRRAAEGFVSVITRDTPCFQCCMQLQAERFQTLRREQGLGLDITTVAHYMAKIAIAMLDQSESEFSRPIHSSVREGQNLLHISNRIGVFSQEPFSVTWLTPARQRCTICSRYERR